MQPVENRMVIDSQWSFLELPEAKEALSKEGYTEIETGTFVQKIKAYEYALERCLKGPEKDQREFQKMLVEWFYSGGEWRVENEC